MSEVHTGLPTWVKPAARQYGGFGCPQCGKPMMVVNSRPEGQGIRRRRYCSCGFRISTLETAIIALPTRAKLQQLSDTIDELSLALAQVHLKISQAIEALPPDY